MLIFGLLLTVDACSTACKDEHPTASIACKAMKDAGTCENAFTKVAAKEMCAKTCGFC